MDDNNKLNNCDGDFKNRNSSGTVLISAAALDKRQTNKQPPRSNDEGVGSPNVIIIHIITTVLILRWMAPIHLALAQA